MKETPGRKTKQQEHACLTVFFAAAILACRCLGVSNFSGGGGSPFSKRDSPLLPLSMAAIPWTAGVVLLQTLLLNSSGGGGANMSCMSVCVFIFS